MRKHKAVLIYVAIAVPLSVLALWGIGTAFGGWSLHDVIAPILIGLGVGLLAYFRPIQTLIPPKPDA